MSKSNEMIKLLAVEQLLADALIGVQRAIDDGYGYADIDMIKGLVKDANPKLGAVLISVKARPSDTPTWTTNSAPCILDAMGGDSVGYEADHHHSGGGEYSELNHDGDDN